MSVVAVAGNQPCTRCGKCCRDAHLCDLRSWVTGDWTKFELCDQLVESEDGTFSCKVIKAAFDDSLNWHEPSREWVTRVFVGRGCELSYDPLKG